MSKKNTELDEEVTQLEGTETEIVSEDPAPETIETPEVENPVTIEPAGVDGDEGATEKPIEQPPVDEQPSIKEEKDASEEQPQLPVEEGKDKEDDDKAEEPVDPFKKFNVRFSYSTDSRSTTSRKLMSVKEMVKQFIAAPTCLLALETKEDIKEFEAIANSKTTIKITNKDGKLIDLPEKGRKHFIERVKEHSNYFINKNGK